MSDRVGDGFDWRATGLKMVAVTRWLCVDATRTIVIPPTWSETLHDLYSATTAPELWRVLVSWHGIGSSSAWDEPFDLLTRFHRDDPADAVATAALLGTDHRWRKASHNFIHHVADAGLLASPDLDQLAEWFVDETFEIEVTLDPDPGGARSSKADRARGRSASPHKATTSIVSRPIWPPLRRWAARRLVQGAPQRWRELIASADALPSSAGAAIAAGVMDAATHVSTDDLPEVVALGLASGSGTVRLAALPALAALEGVDVALARARSDPSAKVRTWAPRITSDLPTLSTTPPPAAPRAPDDDRNQPSLF